MLWREVTRRNGGVSRYCAIWEEAEGRPSMGPSGMSLVAKGEECVRRRCMDGWEIDERYLATMRRRSPRLSLGRYTSVAN